MSGLNAQLRFFVVDHVVRKPAWTSEQTMMLVVDQDVSGQSRRLLLEGIKLEIDYFAICSAAGCASARWRVRNSQDLVTVPIDGAIRSA
jgi:hypothetical protein